MLATGSRLRVPTSTWSILDLLGSGHDHRHARTCAADAADRRLERATSIPSGVERISRSASADIEHTRRVAA